MTRPSTLYHLLRNMKYTRNIDLEGILPMSSLWDATEPRRNPFDHWCHVGYMDTPHCDSQENTCISHKNEIKTILIKEKVE